MIADCEVCGRQSVPVAKVNSFACEAVACFICQGDIADPYGEIELYERDQLRALVERCANAQTPLGDAHDACIELAAKHGFATGHGDTIADMIREFSAQIPTKG